MDKALKAIGIVVGLCKCKQISEEMQDYLLALLIKDLAKQASLEFLQDVIKGEEKFLAELKQYLKGGKN